MMFTSRKELMEAAEKTYRALFERTSARYDSDAPILISDIVSFSCSELEELLRPLWGIAPILRENRDASFSRNGALCTIRSFVTEVMTAGTDPESDRCFSKNVSEETRIAFANQAITEITAYLIAVHFAKDALWTPLTDGQREQIGGWILYWAKAALRDSWPNNHYWYPVFCLEILKELGFDVSDVQAELDAAYGFLDALYDGAGWYSDGDPGRYDYYEAWAHHTYTLLWILIADSKREGYEARADLYRSRSAEFLNFFAHYFDADGGMAAYGRSICYRFAAAAPFGLAVLAGAPVDPGLAQRVVYQNFSYFYENMVFTGDCFPCGYLYESTGFVESYMSAGASVNFTEGYLVLLAGEDSPLFMAAEQKLPIENGRYLKKPDLPDSLFMIRGEQESGTTLYNQSLHYFQHAFFNQRYNDLAGAYSKFAYNSRAGFGQSTADNVSSDQMISLITPRGTMQSHRREILNPRMQDGWMASEHIPFENDPETMIRTYLLPLSEGLHVLVHEVKLARPYKVREGGASIGVSDDDYAIRVPESVPAGGYGAVFSAGTFVSAIRCLASTEEPLLYSVQRIQPGMHLLKPQALYPCYETAVLEPGTYHFMTAVSFRTDGKEAALPLLHLGEKGAELQYREKTYTVRFTL